MATINILGNSNGGRYNVIKFTNSTALPISTYNGNILSVRKISPSGLFFLYKPGDSNLFFTTFEPNEAYVIQATANFTITVDQEATAPYGLLSVSGASGGTYNLIDSFSITSSLPISTYNGNILSVRKISPSGLFFLYKPGDSNLFFTTFEPNESYVIQATANFTVPLDLNSIVAEDDQYSFLTDESMNSIVLE